MTMVERACKELVETEERYIANLVAAARSVAQPALTQRLIDDATHDKLFSCIEQIASLHERILVQLKAARTATEHARPFVENLSEITRLYSAYIGRSAAFDQSVLAGVRRANAPFHALCNAVQLVAPYQTLEALLICPCSRIPRYNLLFSCILKELGPEHADHAAVAEAVQAIQDVANAINEARRLGELQRQFEELADALGPRGDEIRLPTRRLLLFRDVGLESRRHVVAARLVIFDDALLLCKVKAEEPLRLKLVEFGLRTEITLRAGAQVVELELVGRNKTWTIQTDVNTRRELLEALN